MHASTGSLRRFGALIVVVLLTQVMFTSCGSSPKRSVEGFCSTYVHIARSAQSLGNPDEAAIGTLRTRIIEIDDAATSASRKAPRDISNAFDAVIEPLHTLRSQLEHATSRSAVSDAFRHYRVDAAKAAGQQRSLDSWVSNHCGVTPATTTTTTVGAVTTITG